MAMTLLVNAGDPNASDCGNGSLKHPFKTISRAAELARPGDTVFVRAGIYRERITPCRGGENGAPITYQAAPGESVIIKGSDIWRPEWKPTGLHSLILEGRFDQTCLSTYRAFFTPAKRLLGFTLGQIFVDGEYLSEAPDLESLAKHPGCWKLATSGDSLLVHFPPSSILPQSRLIEITVRDRLFAPHVRGLGHIHVRGFIFEHCANQFPSGFWKSRGEDGSPQAGAVSCRSGHHWLVEHNTIRWAKTIGLDCGAEGGFDLEGEQPKPAITGYHVIRNNVFSDNGAGGVAGADSIETQILYNRFERNNCLGWTAPETGGIKVHKFIGGVIEGNIFLDNDCFAIWLDNVWHNSRVSRNVALSSRGAGIFIEMGEGPCLVEHNVVAFTRNGDGIYTHDASGVTVAHNLLYCNSHFGVYMRTVTERSYINPDGTSVRVSTSDQQILNNVFVDNWRGHICMPFPSDKLGRGNVSDYNLFINGTQWHWEGLGFHKFALTTCDGRIDRDEVIDFFEAAFAERQMAENSQSFLIRWLEQPYLSIESWRSITGFDEHSVAPKMHTGMVENGAIEKGSTTIAARGLYFSVTSGLPFLLLRCPRVLGTVRDFYQMPLQDTSVTPGPFQHFRNGENHFPLSPLDSSLLA